MIEGSTYNLVTRILLVYGDMVGHLLLDRSGRHARGVPYTVYNLVTRILLVYGDMVGHFLLDRRGRHARGSPIQPSY